MKKQKIFILIASLLLLWAPALVHARGLVPCGGYTDQGTAEPACTVNDIFYLAARVINFLITVAAVYAAFRIILSGLRLAMSQGNQESIQKAQGGLTNALIGFALVFGAFLIVNTVVNTLLLSKCKIDLTNPTTYLTIQPNQNTCNGPVQTQ